MAVNELALGQADLVITGGVDTLNDIFMFMCFSKTPALSRTGDCRPFSDEADGTMLGEGLAMVALKRLDDAEAAGDRIYAVLRGVGSSSDGRAKSVYAPRAEGQALALRRAYAAAGYGPETVELVEAHGTGTTAGDLAEFEALRTVFDESGRPDRQWCSLGSVKSQIGHTKAAAGAAGLFKAVMALQHGALPPTIKVSRPNPKLAIGESPFCINTAARPWVRGSDHPRRASVSSFGFGGSNFHLTLEEYRGPAPRALRRRAAPSELVLFGAETTEALVRELSGLEIGGAGFLPWLARATQEGVARGSAARLAIVAADEQDLRQKIAAAVEALSRTPDAAIDLPGIHVGVGSPAGGLAYLFAGQGSQYPGMGAGLALLHPGALAAWDLAADLPIEGKVRLQHIVFPPPAFTDEERSRQESQLRRTQWAQPALAAAALAQLNLLAAAGLRPMCVGGHSFGEVAALHAAGVFDAPTFLERCAAARGADGGCRAGAGGDDGGAGRRRAGAGAARPASRGGARESQRPGPGRGFRSDGRRRAARDAVAGRRAAVRCGCRSRRPSIRRWWRMRPAPLKSFWRRFPSSRPRSPSSPTPRPRPIPRIRPRCAGCSRCNSPGRCASSSRSRRCMRAGRGRSSKSGPGRCSRGSSGRFSPAARTARSISTRAGTDAATAFHRGLARLFAAGHEMDLAPLWDSFQPLPDPRELRRPAAAIDICGTNYGKPYPPAGGAAALPPPNAELAVPASRGAACGGRASGGAGAWLAAYRELQHETARGAHGLAGDDDPDPPRIPAVGGALLRRAGAGRGVARGGFQCSVRPGVSPVFDDNSFPFGLRGPDAADLQRAHSRSAAGDPPLAPPLRPARAGAASSIRRAAVRGRSPARSSAVDGPSSCRAPPGLLAALLAVVAEKTGYPVDLLRPEMALEADLGIDSVKRVEILSALEERLPRLAAARTGGVDRMRTLGDIVARLESAGCGTVAPIPAGRGGGRHACVAGATSAAPPVSISRRCSSRSWRRRPATRPNCCSWRWRSRPTWASTRSSGSRSSRPWKSDSPVTRRSIPRR